MPFVAVLSLLAVLTTPASHAPLPSERTCAALSTPVTGPIIDDFAPVGSYAGHWGIDYGVPIGTRVGAADAGLVTFAGSVAGMLAVSVDHGGGLKTSYSYLSEIAVSSGARLHAGGHVGVSGEHHGMAALHFSVGFI